MNRQIRKDDLNLDLEAHAIEVVAGRVQQLRADARDAMTAAIPPRTDARADDGEFLTLGDSRKPGTGRWGKLAGQRDLDVALARAYLQARGVRA